MYGPGSASLHQSLGGVNVSPGRPPAHHHVHLLSCGVEVLGAGVMGPLGVDARQSLQVSRGRVSLHVRVVSGYRDIHKARDRAADDEDCITVINSTYISK